MPDMTDKENLLIGCDEISTRMRRDWRTCAKILDAKGLLHKESGQYVLHWPTYLETLKPKKIKVMRPHRKS